MPTPEYQTILCINETQPATMAEPSTVTLCIHQNIFKSFLILRPLAIVQSPGFSIRTGDTDLGAIRNDVHFGIGRPNAGCQENWHQDCQNYCHDEFQMAPIWFSHWFHDLPLSISHFVIILK